MHNKKPQTSKARENLTVPNNEKIEASKSLFFSGTSTLAIWIVLGTLATLLINTLFGWLFLGFSAFVVLVVIRRLLCNSCYYCKSCTKGFAKLSKLSLSGNRIPGVGKSSTLGMAATMYIVLSVIPGALLANSMFGGFSLQKLSVLISLLLLTAYTVIVRVKNGYK